MTSRYVASRTEQPRRRRLVRRVGARAAPSQAADSPQLGGEPDEAGVLAPAAFPESGSKRLNADGLPDVLTVPQVASYLQVSRSVVYGEINAGRLPAVRLGMRVIRVSKWALQRWLERRTGRE